MESQSFVREWVGSSTFFFFLDSENFLRLMSHDESISSVVEFDFKEQEGLSEEFRDSYLRQYYQNGEMFSDEIAVYHFLHDVLQPRLRGNESYVEVGCGPTVHHALMMSDIVAEMTMADYLEQNLEYVWQWKCRDSRAWDWSYVSAFCAQCAWEKRQRHLPSEEEERSIEWKLESDRVEIEERTREKISAIRTCDLLQDRVFNDEKIQFDVVGAFYCTEEVTTDVRRWRDVVASLSTAVRPGGHLVLVCLHNTDHYLITREDGESSSLPSARIDFSTMKETLDGLGYEVRDDWIVVKETPDLHSSGIEGVILACAYKSS